VPVRRSASIARVLVAALACSSAFAQEEPGPPHAILRRELIAHDVLAACTPRNVTLTARRIVDLGAAAADELTRACVHATESWSDAQREAIENALRERLADARAALLAVAAEERAFEVHSRGLDLLSRIGAARDLPTALALARTSEPAAAADADSEELASPASALRACAARLIERNPTASRELTRAMLGDSDELACALVDALVDVGRTSELDALGELLLMHAWSDTYLMGAISRTARKLHAPFEEPVLAAVRAQLRAADVAIAREAATCAGWLEDEVAADELATLLEHTDAGVRASAKWALHHMTRRDFAGDALKWRRWIDAQHLWWQERAARVFEDIARGTPMARAAALNDALRQSWPRHELARELARALPSDDPRTVALGCEMLANLRSRAAVPPLRELLQVVDARVYDVVEATLCALESPPAAPAKAAGG
jgi:hypothetical protein